MEKRSKAASNYRIPPNPLGTWLCIKNIKIFSSSDLVLLLTFIFFLPSSIICTGIYSVPSTSQVLSYALELPQCTKEFLGALPLSVSCFINIISKGNRSCIKILHIIPTWLLIYIASIGFWLLWWSLWVFTITRYYGRILRFIVCSSATAKRCNRHWDMDIWTILPHTGSCNCIYAILILPLANGINFN